MCRHIHPSIAYHHLLFHIIIISRMTNHISYSSYFSAKVSSIMHFPIYQKVGVVCLNIFMATIRNRGREGVVVFTWIVIYRLMVSYDINMYHTITCFTFYIIEFIKRFRKQMNYYMSLSYNLRYFLLHYTNLRCHMHISDHLIL